MSLDFIFIPLCIALVLWLFNIENMSNYKKNKKAR